ncbi:O-antigen translocase [Thiomicrorhabdus sp. zzn3]|uniref:O-antigen translocase n=1 Tax=Thiomicrorhabdus sp. zzn3 TaxID=3039775 RepID=UPI0024365E55|nr:O-antigen translocase [Thiomicrorhabdus sp. zzn3]MDG6777368.1 O-antigen translocase [Thiomicrorhabdus sp. zzn3]
MKVLTSALLIGMAQFSKIALGLFLIKIVAYFLGPEGLGRLGHLISLVAFLTIISGGGIQNAIVKYVSEYRAKPIFLVSFINASAGYSLIVSLFFLFVFSVFSKEIAQFLFSDPSLYWTIVAVSFFQILMAFNKLVASVANGFKNTKVYAVSQVSGNLLAIPLIWWLVYAYGFVGGIFAVFISYLTMFLPSLYFYKKSFLWKIRKSRRKFFKKYDRLYGFSLMALVSAVTFPLVEIYIRQMIIGYSGYEEAGIWQAAIKISSVYVGFFGLFLAYYFVPSISPEENIQKIKSMVWKYLIVVGGLFSLGAAIFYLGRGYFIPLLLSDEFLSLSDVIQLQLIGDFFKILAFVIGFVFVAKAIVWIYIAMEVLQGVLLVLFTSFLYGADPQIQSVFEGYILTNVSFLIVLASIYYWYLKSSKFKGGC